MYEKLPNELKQHNNWVCSWVSSKCPIDCNTGKGAKSNDPNTWVSYDEAYRFVESNIYDYLGYMFSNNGIIGIDIDTGLDDEGFFNDMTLDIINKCKSYTELSKSGRGVHIFLKGKLPFKGKNNNGIEIYREGRYFICTGRNVAYNEIIENQEAIDYILDKYFKNCEEIANKGNNQTKHRDKVYSPIYKVNGSKIGLKPYYPPIEEGSRHISMVSIAGTLHKIGYNKVDIYQELCKVNKENCNPKLPDNEIMSIVESVTRYAR